MPTHRYDRFSWLVDLVADGEDAVADMSHSDLLGRDVTAGNAYLKQPGAAGSRPVNSELIALLDQRLSGQILDHDLCRVRWRSDHARLVWAVGDLFVGEFDVHVVTARLRCNVGDVNRAVAIVLVTKKGKHTALSKLD